MPTPVVGVFCSFTPFSTAVSIAATVPALSASSFALTQPSTVDSVRSAYGTRVSGLGRSTSPVALNLYVPSSPLTRYITLFTYPSASSR